MPRATHYGNNYFKVYSSKVNRVCTFYSNLEYFNFLTLEINPKVKAFLEQPHPMTIILNGEEKKAIPDVLVEYRDGSEEYQEVKYTSELYGSDEKSLRSQEQIRREKEWAENNNATLVVRTEKDICKGRYLIRNANVMAARIRRYVPMDAAYYNPRILKALENNNKVTYKDLVDNNLLPIENELEHLCYMYVNGLIDFDIMNKPIDYNMEIKKYE